MPLRRGNVDKFFPVRGIVTEANKGNFPEDAAVDAANVEFLVDGTVMRRKGLDAPRGYRAEFVRPQLNSTRSITNYFSYYRWTSVGTENVNYAVTHYGGDVYIRREDDLDNYVINVDMLGRESKPLSIAGWDFPFEFVGNKQMLIVVSEFTEPVFVLVGENEGANKLTILQGQLSIRQEELLKPYSGITAGTTIDDLEEFDLRNSGWAFYASCLDDQEGAAVTQQDPVENFKTHHTSKEYPSPAILYHRNKATNATLASGEGAFSTWEVYKSTHGLLQPPLGKAIINPFEWDTAAAMTAMVNGTGGSKISGTTTSFSIDNRPRSVAIHNGHVFYGGRLWNEQPAIFVSQLIQEDFKGAGENSFERCYSQADPTDPVISGLIATDGMVITPSGTGQFIKMVEFHRGLMIFSERQVIYLTGQGNQVGFTPTAFKVDIVSEEPAVSQKSIVIADDFLFYWSRRGIQVIQRDNNGGMAVQNITDQVIKSIFDGFNRGGLPFVAGQYVQEEKKIYWTVPDSGDADGNQQQLASIILVYDFQIGGFYYHTIGTDDTTGVLPRLLYPMVIPRAGTGTTSAPDMVGFGVIYRRLPLDFTHTHSIDFVGFVGETFHDWNNMMYTKEQWEIDPNGQPDYADYLSFVEFGYVYPETKVGFLGANYIHSFFKTKRPGGIELNDITYEDYQ